MRSLGVIAKKALQALRRRPSSPCPVFCNRSLDREAILPADDTSRFVQRTGIPTDVQRDTIADVLGAFASFPWIRAKNKRVGRGERLVALWRQGNMAQTQRHRVRGESISLRSALQQSYKNQRSSSRSNGTITKGFRISAGNGRRERLSPRWLRVHSSGQPVDEPR